MPNLSAVIGRNKAIKTRLKTIVSEIQNRLKSLLICIMNEEQVMQVCLPDIRAYPCHMILIRRRGAQIPDFLYIAFGEKLQKGIF